MSDRRYLTLDGVLYAWSPSKGTLTGRRWWTDIPWTECDQCHDRTEVRQYMALEPVTMYGKSGYFCIPCAEFFDDSNQQHADD